MIDLNLCHKVVISRTDAIGDVILTTPLAGVLKKYWPHLKVIFLVKNYTRALVERSQFIDEVWCEEDFKDLNQRVDFLKAQKVDAFFHIFPNKHWSKAAKQAKLPYRIGTSRRWYHWFSCNALVNLSRKKSALHELELNLILLQKSIARFPELSELKPYFSFYGFKTNPKKSTDERRHVILHPGSRGSSKDWPVEKFVELSKALPKDKFKVFVSGTENEGEKFRPYFNFDENIVDVSGKTSLSEFIDFVASCDDLVANSTGPLHIAAAVGVHAVGIYPPMRPVHPGRWAPVGQRAEYIVADKPDCSMCVKSNSCFCVQSISVEQVIYALNSLCNV